MTIPRSSGVPSWLGNRLLAGLTLGLFSAVGAIGGWALYWASHGPTPQEPSVTLAPGRPEVIQSAGTVVGSTVPIEQLLGAFEWSLAGVLIACGAAYLIGRSRRTPPADPSR